MEWAQRRRIVVTIILIAVVISILLIIGFAIFYKTPTCFDNSQNQDETGIDCGGSCSTLCSAEANSANIRFTRTVVQSGRTDVIAYIDNPNREAYAKDAHLTLEVYGEDGTVARRHIAATLLPGGATPLYVPGVFSTGIPVRQAFLSFDEGYPIWTRSESLTPMPTVSGIKVDSAGVRPRITAVLENPTAYVIRNVPVVVTVFAETGLAIAASQSVVPNLPPQGTAPIVFTWNEPFTGTPARVEIVPLIALPATLP